MLVSVVVPAFNEEKVIETNLNRMRNAFQCSQFVEGDWEIVVCDNNSTDETSNIAKSAGAKVVFEPINQISRARNRGAEFAMGKWLLFIDSDSYPPYELINDVHALIAGNKSVGASSTMKWQGDTSWKLKLFMKISMLVMRTMKIGGGAFILCESHWFKDIGGFNAELYITEDVELTNKLKIEGKKSNRPFEILCKHPLVTSPRKFELYKSAEIASLLSGLLVRTRIKIRDKSRLFAWYDGRR